MTTEVFDLTKLETSEQKQYFVSYHLYKFQLFEEELRGLTLPSEVVFAHVEDNETTNSSTYIVARKDNPKDMIVKEGVYEYISGTVYVISKSGRKSIPFLINTVNAVLEVDETEYLRLNPNYTPKELLSLILNSVVRLDALNTKKVRY